MAVGWVPDERGATMKCLLLVCWDAGRMDAQTEPDPGEARNDETFPWLDDVQDRGKWVTGGD